MSHCNAIPNMGHHAERGLYDGVKLGDHRLLSCLLFGGHILSLFKTLINVAEILLYFRVSMFHLVWSHREEAICGNAVGSLSLQTFSIHRLHLLPCACFIDVRKCRYTFTARQHHRIAAFDNQRHTSMPCAIVRRMLWRVFE